MIAQYGHIDARDIRPGDLLFDLQMQQLPGTYVVRPALLLVIGPLEPRGIAEIIFLVVRNDGRVTQRACRAGMGSDVVKVLVDEPT